VLIVKDNAICKREFGLWKAFHASSEGRIRNMIEDGDTSVMGFGIW
jgi:hypothetical protein